MYYLLQQFQLVDYYYYVFSEIERLGREEVECESKTIVIEFCCNNQGQFMQIYEVSGHVPVLVGVCYQPVIVLC